MMAMFSVRFAYKISSVMFKFRPNNDNKNYADDLFSSTVDRVEYCLVKHMLFLLDNFGLFPTLKGTLNLENMLEKEVLIVFSAYNKVLVSSKQYRSVIQDEERELDKLKTDADIILDKWDQFYRSTNRNRPMGIAWPLKHGDVSGLPPIAHIIMAWGCYIGKRFELIADHLNEITRQKPDMTSSEQGQLLIDHESLNMFNMFRGCKDRTVLMKQIKKNGSHAWGGNRIRGGKVIPTTVVDSSSFDCFDILSTKTTPYNLLDFASKLIQPTDSLSQFNCKNLIHDSTRITPFKISIDTLVVADRIPVLSPGVVKKTWSDDDIMEICLGGLPAQSVKSPKLTLFQCAPRSLINVLRLRKKSTKNRDVDLMVRTVDISYGSRNFEVQLVNMINLQRKLKISDDVLFDRNSYITLYQYCESKQLDIILPSIDEYDIGAWRAAFLENYPAVKQEIVKVLGEIQTDEPVKGHVSTNLRTRDRSQGKTENTRHPPAASGSSDSDSVTSVLSLHKSRNSDPVAKKQHRLPQNSNSFDTSQGNIELKTGKAVKGHVSAELRTMDRMQMKTSKTPNQHASSGSSDSNSENSHLSNDHGSGSEDFNALPNNSTDINPINNDSPSEQSDADEFNTLPATANDDSSINDEQPDDDSSINDEQPDDVTLTKKRDEFNTLPATANDDSPINDEQPDDVILTKKRGRDHVHDAVNRTEDIVYHVHSHDTEDLKRDVEHETVGLYDANSPERAVQPVLPGDASVPEDDNAITPSTKKPIKKRKRRKRA
jgi:hypothetical protein